MNIFGRYKVHNLKRFREVLGVFAKHGFGYVFDVRQVNRQARKSLQGASTDITLENSQAKALALRKVLEELGPTYIKLGQVLSTRPDLIPQEFIDEFRKLQDRAPAFGYEIVEEILKKEYGNDIDSIFSSIDPYPLAAASLSQVHKAVLVDGQHVVIKVQRPHIEGTIREDIEMLRYGGRLVEQKIVGDMVYSPIEIINEFERVIHEELDFERESANIKRFNSMFEGRDYVVIPKVLEKLTTKKIVVMSYVEGVPVGKILSSHVSIEDRQLIVSRLVQITLDQIFTFGFFHADLHHGNIFICDDNKIGLVDFGMVGTLSDQDRDLLAQLLLGVLQKDPDLIIEVYELLNETVVIHDKYLLKKEISRFLDDYYGLTLEDVHIGHIVNDLFAIMHKHGLAFPYQFTLLLRTLSILETVCAELDPSFNLVTYLNPYIKQLIKQRYSLEKLVARGKKVLHETLLFLDIVPEEFSIILKKIRRGELTMNFHHRGLNRVIDKMDDAIDDIAYSVIIASIIIGSSLVMTADVGPHVFGYPFLGFLGYTVSFLLGFVFVVRIFMRSIKKR